jgi:hypothetical protein
MTLHRLCYTQSAKRIKYTSTCPPLLKVQAYDFSQLGNYYAIIKPFGEGPQEEGLSFILGIKPEN